MNKPWVWVSVNTGVGIHILKGGEYEGKRKYYVVGKVLCDGDKTKKTN